MHRPSGASEAEANRLHMGLYDVAAGGTRLELLHGAEPYDPGETFDGVDASEGEEEGEGLYCAWEVGQREDANYLDVAGAPEQDYTY